MLIAETIGAVASGWTCKGKEANYTCTPELFADRARTSQLQEALNRTSRALRSDSSRPIPVFTTESREDGIIDVPMYRLLIEIAQAADLKRLPGATRDRVVSLREGKLEVDDLTEQGTQLALLPILGDIAKTATAPPSRKRGALVVAGSALTAIITSSAIGYFMRGR